MNTSVGSRAELERLNDALQLRRVALGEYILRAKQRVDEAMSATHAGTAQNPLVAAQTQASAAQLLLKSASTTSAGVKDSIQDAEIAHERAKAAKAVVEQVSTLRACVHGVMGAMELKEWERAAELASRALAVPEEVQNSPFALKMVPSAEYPEPPAELLTSACNQMEEEFQREFKHAARTALASDENNSQAQRHLTRYFKLFPLIGKQQSGLLLYAEFINQLIAQMARLLLISASKGSADNALFFGFALSKLFENVAAVIDQHRRLILKHYGEDAMLKVLPAVQREIDKQALLIIDTFWDERRMESLLARSRAYSYPVLMGSFDTNSSGAGGGGNASSNAAASAAAAAAANSTDVKEAGDRIAELSMMLNRYGLYVQFAKRIAAEPKSEVGERIESVLGPVFESLELYVFRRSVETAISMDALPTQEQVRGIKEFSEEQPLVSSLVDDVLVVLSGVVQHAVDTNDSETVKNSLSALSRVLEGDLVGSIQRKLRTLSPSPSTAGTEFAGAAPFMVYLNDLQTLVVYVDYISKQHEVFAPVSTSFATKVSELIADGCRTLYNTRLQSQCRHAAQEFATGEFEPAWRAMLRPLRQLLHPKVRARLLTLMCRSVAADLEQYLWSLNGRCSASQLLELERDFGAAISVCVESEYKLRSHFAHLAQLVSALVEGDFSQLNADDTNRCQKFRLTE